MGIKTVNVIISSKHKVEPRPSNRGVDPFFFHGGGGGKMRHEVILCVRSAHHEREESLSAGVPLKGPGSSRVLDAL